MTDYKKCFNIVKLAYSVYNDGIETGVTDPQHKISINLSPSIVSAYSVSTLEISLRGVTQTHRQTERLFSEAPIA